MVSKLLRLCFLSTVTLVVHSASFPSKIYGVNLGSWLLIEPWMLPAEWASMGGESCPDCSNCIASEFSFAKEFPDKVDRVFNTHWDSWFNQDDVDRFVAAGLNTVRIPLGYWIVEPIVDRNNEFFARGGFRQLIRGLRQLKNAGIVAILAHHGLPGVQTPGQQFAGRCTHDVKFYTDYNYHRALIWSATMTAFSHLSPDFSSVISIQAAEEPLMDANMTPGYGTFQKHFVQTVRAVEFALGLSIPGLNNPRPPSSYNLTRAFQYAINQQIYDAEVRAVLQDSISVINQMAKEFGLQHLLTSISRSSKELLTTNFMDVNWQHNNPSNPADAKIGPQIYDSHLYFSFGGVAAPNEDAYMRSICHLDRVEADAALGNSPLMIGEWALPTEFYATDGFLFKWADAQKLAYSKGAGWIFFNFKIEISSTAGDMARQWSYFEGLKRGYLTRDPAAVHNPHVCDQYMKLVDE
ncbi:glycoside hydrolase family 5 protein [Amanita thiersii Skay4041]|uniref:Glycoside hydrolase family 5 protein n=1 Tax=Amanita thiersii Skay4041 TaxID=703135 RepID=A0A2A9P1C8_9AGAR|nr:glycoside hydrolase family 5 protein [Amanita thiersii Skay4041]